MNTLILTDGIVLGCNSFIEVYKDKSLIIRKSVPWDNGTSIR